MIQIEENNPAKTSSKRTLNEFFCRSIIDIGQGLKISNSLKKINDINTNNGLSIINNIAINCPTTSSITITLESFSPVRF